ncbi:MAG: LuxR C-terminal-related transcriptional regulator [Dehalococcoidia bacterium]
MSRSNTSDPAQRVELTPRQQDVIRLIAKGLTNGEIAERLDLTLDGVKWHVREILGKCGVDSREEAVERWRTQRRRLPERMWSGGILASTAVRWVGGIAVAGAGAAAGIGIAWTLAGYAEPAELAKKAVVEEVRAADDPLRLVVQGAQADPNEVAISVWVYGEPGFGELVAPTPEDVVISDANGTIYPTVAVTRNGENTRSMTITAAPPAPGVGRLHIEVRSLSFLSSGSRGSVPAAEVRPVLPWIAEVDDIARPAQSSVIFDFPPQPFGLGSLEVVSVRQTATRSIFTLRIRGLDDPDGLVFSPIATLIDAAGNELHPLVAIGSPGGDDQFTDLQFSRIEGPVTLNITGISSGVVRRLATADDGKVVVGMAEGSWPRIQEATAKMQESFDSQTQPSWNLTLP